MLVIVISVWCVPVTVVNVVGVIAVQNGLVAAVGAMEVTLVWLGRLVRQR